MSTSQQPEALRLADAVRTHDDHPRVHFYNRVAAELRRQHARIAELEAARIAYASEFKPDADGDPDVGNIHANIRALKAQLFAIAHTAEGATAQTGAYAEARECEHCNHVGINDAANGIASCTACKWNGDSPKEDKCPDCEAEGAMTASCPKCHHEYRLIADATLAATQPTQQGLEKDAEAIRTAVLSCGHTIERDFVTLWFEEKKEGHNALNQLGRRIAAALAAQAKQGEPKP